MFMFRSKRTALTKQLVKARKRRCDEARRALEDLAELLKRLKDNQLEMLYGAVEGRGEEPSDCVLLPRDQRRPPPQLLCCQTWRWPEVRHLSELRRLPACRSASDPVYICCNPYHWSRLCQPETPPPPYSRCAMDDSFRPEDRAPSEAPLVCRDTYPGSLTTNGEDSSYGCSRGWCKLAYWEMSRRVGPLYDVEPPHLNVFGDIPCGDGLSLTQLALHSFSPPDSVNKTRCKIGLGVTLSREEDGGIWVYNRSEHPIFVNSATLEDAYITPPMPTRVPAEHCLCVFDPARSLAPAPSPPPYPPQGPIDRNSVQVSFVKGWGPGYSRREVASCPCWLEILLAPCR